MKHCTMIVALAMVVFAARAESSFGERLMGISLVSTDLTGNPIASIEAGSPYRLNVFTRDLRDPIVSNPGVFGAGVDVVFDSALSSVDVGQTAQFDEFFGLVQDTVLQQGRIIGYGAATRAADTNDPQFVFSVVLTATIPGTQVFTPGVSPSLDHENLLFLRNDALLPDEVLFVGTTLTIVPEPSAVMLGAAALIGLLVLVGRGRRR